MFLLSPAQPWEFRWRIVIVFLSLPLLAIFVNRYQGDPLHLWYAPEYDQSLCLTGAVFASLGVFLRLWGTETLTVQTMLNLKANTSALVKSGPFAFSRSPLYTGTLLCLAGFSLCFGIVPTVLFVLFHAIRFHRIVLHEEVALKENWGTQYEEYQESVPRWLPRWSLLWSRSTPLSFPLFRFRTIFSNAPFVSTMLGLWVSFAFQNTLALMPALLIGLIVSGIFLLLSPPS